MKASTSTPHVPRVGMVGRMCPQSCSSEMGSCGGTAAGSLQKPGEEVCCLVPLFPGVSFMLDMQRKAAKSSPLGASWDSHPTATFHCPVAYCLWVQSRTHGPDNLLLSHPSTGSCFSSWLARNLSWHLSSVIKQEMHPPWPLSSILSRGSEEICGGYSWRSGSGEGEKSCS